jgi:putative ABC transport system ATP-binding protein
MGTGALIQVRDVHKSFLLGEVKLHALRGLDLDINTGEFTALIGASGSGKSSLLNLIGCIDVPDSGKISIDGQELSNLSEWERSQVRNQKIGFVFQSFNLIPVLNVFENVELPLLIQPGLSKSERHDRVERALADVQLSDRRNYYPDRLSGGQRQRVAIARALVTQPKIILADEPTASLDSKTAHLIIDLMIELNKSKKVTFFFCSHDEKLIDRVDKVVRISDGIIQP